MKSTFWVLLMVLAVSLQIHAQCTLQITGQVLDEHDQSPLDYSTIYILESGKGTLADSLGRFTLKGICPGTWTLTCSHIGCDPISTTIVLTTDTILNFYPEHHIELLDQITTTANKISEAPAQTRTDLSGQALERLQGRSLAQMVSSISGVTMVQTGPGIAKPMIHGLYGNRILIIQNDVRQEGQQWGVDHTPEVDPTIAGKMTVIKGAEGVRYGPEALGGVILMKPDPLPRAPGIRGTLMSLLQSNGWGGKVAATLEGGFRRPGWGWRTTGSIHMLGDQQAPDYFLSNTGQREGSFSIQSGYTGYKGTVELYYSFYRAQFGILRAAHIGNLSDLEAAIAANEPWYQVPFSYQILNPRQAVNHHLAKIEASRKLSAMWTLKSRYNIQFDNRKEYDIRRGDRDNIPALDLTIISQQAEILAEHRPWRHLTGAAGVSGQYQTNYNEPGTGVRPLVPNYTSATASLFGFERYIHNRYELEAGLRADYKTLRVAKFDDQNQIIRPSFDWLNVSATGGGLYRFSPQWDASFQLASAFRSPGPNELYSEGLHHSTAALEIGRDDLTIERSLKSILTVRHHSNGLTIDLSGYVNPIYGYIFLEPSGEFDLTIRGAFPVYTYQQTDALLTGIDLDVRMDLTSWLAYQGNAALLWSDDQNSDEPLFGMPPFQFNHNLSVFSKQTAEGNNFAFRVQAKHVLRQKHSTSTDYSAPPQGYALVGLVGEWQKANIRLNLGVDNLFNNTYRDYLDRLRYFVDAPGQSVYINCFYHF